MPSNSWRAKNPEKHRVHLDTQNAKRRANPPVQNKEYQAWYRSQPENQAKRRAYENERDKRLRSEAAVEREKIPPTPLLASEKAIKQREYMRAWREKNLEKYREQKRIWNNNRDRKCKAGGKLTLAEWREIQAKQHGLCFDCGERRRMTIGHLVPLSRGGTHTAANIVAQCMACNSKQGTTIHSSVSG